LKMAGQKLLGGGWDEIVGGDLETTQDSTVRGLSKKHLEPP